MGAMKSQGFLNVEERDMRELDTGWWKQDQSDASWERLADFKNVLRWPRVKKYMSLESSKSKEMDCPIELSEGPLPKTWFEPGRSCIRFQTSRIGR